MMLEGWYLIQTYRHLGGGGNTCTRAMGGDCRSWGGRNTTKACTRDGDGRSRGRGGGGGWGGDARRRSYRSQARERGKVVTY